VLLDLLHDLDMIQDQYADQQYDVEIKTI